MRYNLAAQSLLNLLGGRSRQTRSSMEGPPFLVGRSQERQTEFSCAAFKAASLYAT